jgi:hypothetical protein
VFGSQDFGAPRRIIHDKEDKLEEDLQDFRDNFSKLEGFLLFFIIKMQDFWTLRGMII